MATTSARWTRLNDGTWGVRVDGHVGAGAEILISKRDGTSSTERVERVLWTGTAKDGREATLVTVARSAASASSTGHGHYHPHKCIVCGHVERRDARGYAIGDRILRSGECQSCYEERKMGY